MRDSRNIKLFSTVHDLSQLKTTSPTTKTLTTQTLIRTPTFSGKKLPANIFGSYFNRTIPTTTTTTTTTPSLSKCRLSSSSLLNGVPDNNRTCWIRASSMIVLALFSFALSIVFHPPNHTVTFIGLLSLRTRNISASTIESKRSIKLHSTIAVQNMPPMDFTAVERKVKSALWSYFAGDALASPTHWFYGGFPQVQKYYGREGIKGYTKPVYGMAGSILNKSNLSGGGRATPSLSRGMLGVSAKDADIAGMPPTIIGHVINHGKQHLWDPSKEIHYHATLQAGENTLEVQIARVLMQSIAATNGRFDANHFRNAYVKFMTTPGSHNDTYASTCHRMFFANFIYKQLPPDQCPDNDSHNVDTIDGLVLPTITALAVAGRMDGTIEEAAEQAAATAAVTRRSQQLEQYAAEWGKLVFTTIRAEDSQSKVQSAAQTMAKSLRLRQPAVRTTDEITACYLSSAVPAMLDSIVKYSSLNSSSVWNALLANANTGGENVHRGSCLGAVLGAVATEPESTSINTKDFNHQQLITGLHDRASLEKEIQSFWTSISKTSDDTK